MNRPPPVPLDHRVRRRILRRLNEVGDARTASELSADLGLGLSEVLYHAGVLGKYEKVRESRQGGDRANIGFESAVAEDPEIITLLTSTEAEDEPQ